MITGIDGMENNGRKNSTIYSFVIYAISLVVLYLLTNNEIRSDIIIYYVFLSSTLFLLSVSKHVKAGTHALFIAGIIVFGLLYALRDNIGIDDAAYLRYFQSAGNNSLMQYLTVNGIEKGYLFVNYCLYYLCNGNYDIARCIISFIPFVFFGKAFWNNKSGFSASIGALIIWTHYYFLTMGNGLVRLFIAVSICYYALDSLIEKQRGKYIFFVMVASFFHASSLVMLLYLLLTIKREWFFKHWKVFIMVMVTVVPTSLYIIGRYIVPALHLHERYMGYSEMGSLSFSLLSLDVLPVFVLGILCYRNINKAYRERYTIGLILCMFSVLISIVSSIIPMSRLVFFGNLGIVIVISGIAKSEVKSFKHYCILGVLVFYAILYMHVTGLWNIRLKPNLLPYRFFFS